MKINTYIAIVFAFIFLAKFVAIDANGLNMFLTGDTISFVKNPHCKKQNPTKELKSKINFSESQIASLEMIPYSGRCTTPFHFKIFSWEFPILNSHILFNEHLPSKLRYLYLKKVSPPPRSA